MITIASHAKVWRINNTGIPADFTTVQDAIYSPSVTSGDTLHIEPSSASYGDALITKRLTLIGNGYHLSDNPGLKENSLTSSVSILTIAAEDVVITGLDISNVRINMGRAIIKRNRIDGIQLLTGSAITDIIITQNYIINMFTLSERQVTNMIISNNYIGAGFQYDASNLTGVITNNIINISQSVTISGFLVKNNIISGPFNFMGSNTYYNNICSGTHVPAGYGNQLNVDLTTVYAGGSSRDGQYALSETSVAKAAGYDGEDCGIFGGADAYKLSGIPGIPSIQYLNVPASSEGNTLKVIISVKSNQ